MLLNPFLVRERGTRIFALAAESSCSLSVRPEQGCCLIYTFLNEAAFDLRAFLIRYYLVAAVLGIC